jgi:hypothetical protein
MKLKETMPVRMTEEMGGRDLAQQEERAWKGNEEEQPW